ncbi:hypothetical protein RJ639_040345 [Escallonia herrerae]|uniref:Charged multivesicular body protein 7 n=1 Tax=Escallonia herrerae TaxID=1293975 RepID=A0AA89B2K5_9ASTE|nr:hypothetical protein RJ639_040345 [Escallonia herrerae]
MTEAAKEEEEAWLVGEIIRKQVQDWDDEVKVVARYKAFSGQRCDWEHKYLFWRDLIIHIARHLRLFIICPSQVKNFWFNRGGLTPLCLDHVLLEMFNAGDILRRGDLVDPTSGLMSNIVRRVVHLVGLSRSSTPVDLSDDHLILSTLLKEKAAEVIRVLSENHWTSSCIITMRKFREICGGSKEAYAILSHLSECGKAKYLVIKKKDFIEGVKISLLPRAVSGITSLDFDVLHLIWTEEKLQQQVDVIDQRYETSRKLALASLNSGNKVIALRHARELKMASQSREKCITLLNRVEEVLRVIADAESSKVVSEAIQIGARAIKENNMSVEEVQLCLQELDESIDTQKQVEQALESTPSYAEFEESDIEDEFQELELEVGSESVPSPISNIGVDNRAGGETAESLSLALSNLKLGEGVAIESVTQDSLELGRNNRSKASKLEAA